MTSKNEIDVRPVMNARNIAIIQAQIKNEMRTNNGHPSVLNGRVKPSCTDSASTCSEEDLEYEFQYALNDTDRSNSYIYSFDTFPARCSTVEGNYTRDIDKADSTEDVGDGQLQISRTKPQLAKAAFSRDKRLNSGHERDRACSADTTCEVKYAEVKRDPGGTENSIQRVTTTEHQSAKHGRLQVQRKIGVIEKPVFEDNLTETDCRLRKESAYSGRSCKGDDPGEQSGSRYSRRVSRANRKSETYDPALEKATTFIHGGGKNFSRTNTSLTPIKYGMRYLQMSYTKTNLESNQSLIFLDLLKTSHLKTHLRDSQIKSIERRLEVKRKNPLYSTSYYDNKNITDPYRHNAKKTARSAAQKKLERKEKIKAISDEIQTGYVPTQLTMKIAGRKEVVAIGKNCRYLRSKIPDDIEEAE
ncbi:hypothetical protein DPMN_036303 [Dreissena polymorpha]|uniref:Uncharacterized protein n=1 Tax=Dreissena polymorpha TaxID=45954 RepID=A0A9D4RNQ0_DREPO|nr:hypothetical protein DPMN_036303 [Dreissena polymorpha]